MSFLLRHDDESLSTYLFSGDIILGSPSTVVEDLPLYMQTLKKLRDEQEHHFDYVCVPHSVNLSADSTDTVIMDGPKKLEEYIKYREDRIKQL